MRKFFIKGGRRLTGEVRLSGAKNSALKILLAALLTKEKVYLRNVPLKMLDVVETIRMLRSLNVVIDFDGECNVIIDSSKLSSWQVPLDQKFQIRTTLLMLGVLLARFGKAIIPLPGGCKIGERKYDLHLYALRKMGAKIKVSNRCIEASCSRLRGTIIEFPLRTTGGTENTIIAAVLASGKTVIKNAHTNPLIADLVDFLNSMGAKISIIGSGLIEVEGAARLHGTNYKIIFDDIEAITFVIAAAVTGGDITIANCMPEHLAVPLVYLRGSGVKFIVSKKSLRVIAPKVLAPLDLSTGSYPGISTDYQPLFAVLATQAVGMSHITDIRHRERFQYVRELRRMGAYINKKENSIAIKGPVRLNGCRVTALDLRAGAAMVVAGLCAKGMTEISNIKQIDRGYEEIEEKMKKINARVFRA